MILLINLPDRVRCITNVRLEVALCGHLRALRVAHPFAC